MSDISERLATEKQLRQSVEKQQQSQKMEAIGQLTAGLAPDTFSRHDRHRANGMREPRGRIRGCR